jgi:uncharacterized GH25 family protein
MVTVGFSKMQIILCLAVSVLTGLVSLASHAHEFWIEPSDFQPEPGDRVTVDLVIGTDFQGLSSPYTPDEIAAFAMIDAAGERPITGRFGDMPAGQITAAQAGLTLLYHQTGPLFVNYRKPEKFISFATEKGFAEIAALYQQAEVENFRLVEQYRRFAKSLVMVGPAAGQDQILGQDQLLGLEMELVALTNPYQHPAPETFRMAVYESGVPRPGAQVTVFIRHAPRDIEQKIIVADEDGQIQMPLLPGRQYLFDSVKLYRLKNPDTEKDAEWESLWASLTFAVPAD